MSHHNGLVAVGIVAAIGGAIALVVPEWARAVRTSTQERPVEAAPQVTAPAYTWLGNKPAPVSSASAAPATQPARSGMTIIMHGNRSTTRPAADASPRPRIQASITRESSLDKDIVPPTALAYGSTASPASGGNGYAVTGVVRSAARVYTAPAYAGNGTYGIGTRPRFRNTFNNAMGARLSSRFETINQAQSARTATSFLGGPVIASESSQIATRLNGLFGANDNVNQNNQNW